MKKQPDENVWMDIKGWEHLYKVNINGEIISKKTGNNIYPHKNSFGYLVINLYKTWKENTVLKMHRILATAFIPNCS